MAFCGSCGKKAGNSDRFCTSCGSQIREATISVVEELGQVIKEEYKESTAPPDAELSRGSHIGDQKRSGEWLEYITEHILKFAGYQTIRQYAVAINDTTKDKFYVDVLASDPFVEIFVECKDYSETKLPEKILFEFIGQLNHYRNMTAKNVIGIFTMSARDEESKNIGIREKLRKENAYLWDGSFIEHLQNKMTLVQNRDEFHTYVVDHLNVDESPAPKNKDDVTFIMRFGFYTVQKHQYIGKKFDVMNILDDIKKNLSGFKSKIVNHEIETLKADDGTLIRYMVHVDFSITINQNEIIELAGKKKKGLFDKIRKKQPIVDAFDYCVDYYVNFLSSIYGINFEPKGKNNYAKIYYEGGRIA